MRHSHGSINNFFYFTSKKQILKSQKRETEIHATLTPPPPPIYIFFIFYATLPYIRHFIFADCYDNNHWYLVTNLAGHLDLVGHLDLAGFYFSKCPAKFVIHLVMDETQV